MAGISPPLFGPAPHRGVKQGTQHMVRVKICGLTRLGDALHAAACGADALGFITWPGSKRFIATADLARLRRELPPFVQTVGVTVNATPTEVVDLWKKTGIGAVQLHGDETPEAYRGLPMPVIKVFRSPPPVTDLEAWDAVAFMADGAAAAHYGGSGVTADTATVEALAATGRLILAGGLMPETVADAVRRTRPYAVDVASGTEAAPGIKDPDKVRAFIAHAKAALP